MKKITNLQPIIPFRFATILLGLFQVYNIYQFWGESSGKVIASIFILIGCLLLMVFSKKKSDDGGR